MRHATGCKQGYGPGAEAKALMEKQWMPTKLDNMNERNRGGLETKGRHLGFRSREKLVLVSSEFCLRSDLMELGLWSLGLRVVNIVLAMCQRHIA